MSRETLQHLNTHSLIGNTEHRGTADGKPLHIFISDVAVKLTGSETWMDAK